MSPIVILYPSNLFSHDSIFPLILFLHPSQLSTNSISPPISLQHSNYPSIRSALSPVVSCCPASFTYMYMYSWPTKQPYTCTYLPRKDRGTPSRFLCCCAALSDLSASFCWQRHILYTTRRDQWLVRTLSTLSCNTWSTVENITILFN